MGESPTNRPFLVITTIERPGFDADGVPITLQPGDVTNRIMWDGVSEYDPGPDLILVEEATDV